jgi:hypothetical protein
LERPRVLDATGQDRLLGVPAPTGLSVTLNTGKCWTQDDVQGWVVSDFAPALAKALKAALVASHVNPDGSPTAGADAMYCTTLHSEDDLRWADASRSDEAAVQALLGDAGVGCYPGPDGVGVVVPIEALPAWGMVRDVPTLAGTLRTLDVPQSLDAGGGMGSLTEEQAARLAADLAALFDPGNASIANLRQQMDSAVQAFCAAMGAPVDTAQDCANLVAAVKQAKAQAASLHDQIYGEYMRRLGSLDDLVAGVLNGQNMYGAGGLFNPDPDKIIDTRFYVATFVNDWGWESAPCPVSAQIDASQYDTVHGQIAAAPADRNIQKWRLYRSNVGTAQAAYQFVAEGLVADGMNYQDMVKAASLGEVCPTFGWLEPPYRFDNNSAQTIKPPKGDAPYLRGLVSMPNGILAGHIDNYVAFCDPYHPYAWPLEYQITTETPIIGLGVFGQALCVCTKGHPYVISGADSASMTGEKLPQLLPCVSAQSIVGVGDGVIYAGTDGLVYVSAAGAQLVTAQLYAREDWAALGPEKIHAIEYEGVYYFWPADGQCRALDFNAKKLVTVDLPGVTALRRDELSDALFAVQGDALVKLFSAGRMTGAWRSGVITMPKPAALAWGVVFGDQSPAAPVMLRWYGDSGTLLYERQVMGIEPFRLPTGRPLEHEVEIASMARVTRVQLAGSTVELQEM